MIYFIIIISLFIFSIAPSQTPEKFGFKHLVYNFKNDPAEILIKSKKGEEKIQKPLFFFCQGSLPQPLIKYDKSGTYSVFPFNEDSLCKYYHLVIVSKPFIPLIAEAQTLGQNFTYNDSTGHFPKKYSERNLPDYYVNRNIEIIRYLRKQDWVTSTQLVVAGHSEGSTIAAQMATKCSLITHLIYSGGNPLGRIMSIVEEARAREKNTDSTKYAEEEIKYWQNVCANKTNTDDTHGDTDKATYDFSKPALPQLMNLKIPVYVCYGTKDWSAPYNDYLRIECIRSGKKNFTFKSYVGTEHNYFPLKENNTPDYEIFNWDLVAQNWLIWLNTIKK